jgi:hypothetical protein
MTIDNLKGNELFEHLRQNKSELIAAKKSAVKFTDAIVANVVSVAREFKTSAAKDASQLVLEEPVSEAGTLKVTVVCNTAWFCDSHMDVLTDKAYDESITKRGTTIPHIADHKQTSTAHIGDVTKVYTKELQLSELGLAQKGTTTALLMDTTVRADYNEKIYEFYKNGKINQHSIGLRYEELSLAINSMHEDDVAEKAVWDEFYPNIVNKELVDARGYFWAVPKVDVMENSCVLFGSNSLTPTLSAKSINMGEAEQVSKKDKELITQPIGNNMATNEELQAKVIELSAEVQTLKASLAASETKGKQEEQERTLGILKVGETFVTPLSNVSKLISDGYTVKQATNIMEMLKEAEQNKSGINTSINTETGITSSIATEDKFASEIDKAFGIDRTKPAKMVGL